MLSQQLLLRLHYLFIVVLLLLVFYDVPFTTFHLTFLKIVLSLNQKRRHYGDKVTRLRFSGRSDNAQSSSFDDADILLADAYSLFPTRIFLCRRVSPFANMYPPLSTLIAFVDVHCRCRLVSAFAFLFLGRWVLAIGDNDWFDEWNW